MVGFVASVNLWFSIQVKLYRNRQSTEPRRFPKTIG
jgi:hypothetical protein